MHTTEARSNWPVSSMVTPALLSGWKGKNIFQKVAKLAVELFRCITWPVFIVPAVALDIMWKTTRFFFGRNIESFHEPETDVNERIVQIVPDPRIAPVESQPVKPIVIVLPPEPARVEPPKEQPKPNPVIILTPAPKTTAKKVSKNSEPYFHSFTYNQMATVGILGLLFGGLWLLSPATESSTQDSNIFF